MVEVMSVLHKAYRDATALGIYGPIRAVYTGARFLWYDLTTRPNETAIYVLGNHKSGTTAVAWLLAHAIGERYSHDMIHERKALRYRVSRAEQRSFRDMAFAYPGSFSAGVIKDPSFTFRFDEIRKAFPRASFVFVIRDPRDNCRSILNRMGLPGDDGGPDSKPLDYLRSRAPAWAWILDPGEMAPPDSTYIEILAWRWRRAVEACIGDGRAPEILRYEDFLADKEQAIANLAERLGRPHCRDIRPYLERAFQPPGDRSKGWRDFFGLENLARIEDICKPWLGWFGYPPPGSQDHAGCAGASPGG